VRSSQRRGDVQVDVRCATPTSRRCLRTPPDAYTCLHPHEAADTRDTDHDPRTELR
jgi:hypothetical protein